uniref:Uncharacterized protein n=1 Tax=Pseudomonas phage RVTF4 TaxID=3236931 RepID=A0AB39CCJ9_9VIRU
MGVKLTKRGNEWTVEFLGKERHVKLESELVTWRSLGILPHSAIEFNLDLDGAIESIVELSTQTELTELDIPKNHSVAGMVRPTKPYTGGTHA